MNFSEEFRDSQVRFNIHIPFSNSSCPVECEILYFGLLWLWPLMLSMPDRHFHGQQGCEQPSIGQSTCAFALTSGIILWNIIFLSELF